MTRNKEHAIIIGGGFAGPVLALFLRRIGIESTVFEAYPQAATIGGGFQIAPNGMNVLRDLDLAERVSRGAAVCNHFCFRNSRGRVLARFGNGGGERHGQNAIVTSRTAAHRVVLGELEKYGVPIHYGKRLHDIEYSGPAGIVARFEDGSDARGTFLVGADGLRSRTREIVLPNYPPPAYLGVLGIGGLVPATALPQVNDTDRRDMTFTLGRDCQFGYCAGDRDASQWMWWCHLRQARELTRTELASVGREELRQRVLELYRGWHGPVESLIRQTPEIVKTALYDLPPLPAWHNNRVVLIGDAAHAMSPAAGVGLSVALEDAEYLASVLRTASRPVEEAFAQFERDRRPRAGKIVAMARRNEARQAQELGSFGCWLRDRMLSALLPLMGERSLRWVYDYRVDWEAGAKAA